MAQEKRSALASYFSSDEELETVLQLFNPEFLANMLKNVKPEGMETVINYLVYESNSRAKRPTEGCIGVLIDLEKKMAHEREELRYIKHQIACCKAQFSPEGFVKFYEKHGIKLSGVTDDDDDQDYIDLGPIFDDAI